MVTGQLSQREKNRKRRFEANKDKFGVCPKCHRKGITTYIQKKYSGKTSFKKLWGIRYCTWCGILFPVEEDIVRIEEKEGVR